MPFLNRIFLLMTWLLLVLNSITLLTLVYYQQTFTEDPPQYKVLSREKDE